MKTKFKSSSFYLLAAFALAGFGAQANGAGVVGRDDSTSQRGVIRASTTRELPPALPLGGMCGFRAVGEQQNRNVSTVTCQGFDLVSSAAGWHNVSVWQEAGADVCSEFSCGSGTPAGFVVRPFTDAADGVNYSTTAFTTGVGVDPTNSYWITVVVSGAFTPLSTRSPSYRDAVTGCPSGYTLRRIGGDVSSHGDSDFYSCIAG